MNAEALQQQKVDRVLLSTVRRFFQWVSRPHPSLTDELAQRRSRLLAHMSFAVFVIASAFFINQVRLNPGFLDDLDTMFILGGIVLVLASFLINRTGRVNLAAILFIGNFVAVFTLVPFVPGASREMLFFTMMPILLTAVFFSVQVTIYLGVGILVAVQALGVVAQESVLWPVMFLALVGSIIFTFIRHLQFQEGLRAKELESINQRLRVSEESLEQRVQERTRDLQVAADVSLQITTVLDRAALLADVAERTATAFGLYHVSIFLHDEKPDVVRMHQGVGETGRQLVEMGKQFALTDAGLVPQAARTLHAALSGDVRDDVNHSHNPLLPDTRSELAIPIVYRGKLIGVLDLQSQTAHRFGEEDIRIMRTLADQIAIAVRNSQLFEETNIALAQAERANAVKSTFLSSMSHELRTPMNAIINFTKFVAKGSMGPVTQQQHDTLTEVIDSAKHLLNLINDVLDMSKIEAGSLKLFIEPNVDLNTILRTVQLTGKSLLAEKQVELVSEVEEDFPPITGDKQRILQILLNVLSNACKFTDAGRISIRAYRDGEDVVTAIADSGPGIAPEDQYLVFEAFKQTETGLRRGGGTGLGMPISRSLAEAHGGRLWLESELGKGSVFYVALPIKSAILEPSFAL